MSKFIPLLFSIALLATGSKLSANPANAFQRAQHIVNKAERLEKDGEADRARELFSSALEKLQAIRQADPDWDPEPVKELIQRCSGHMRKIDSEVPQRTPEDQKAISGEIKTDHAAVLASSGKREDRRSAELELGRFKSQLKTLEAENQSLQRELAKVHADLRQIQMQANENKGLKSQLAKTRLQLEILQEERGAMREGYERTKLTVEAANLERLQRLLRENESLKERLARAIP